MRDARELSDKGIKPSHIVLSARIGTPCATLHCTEAHRDTVLQISPPNGIKLATRYASKWKPEAYVFNLRPGLPLWLFWTFQRRGVPCVGIAAEGQLEQHTDVWKLVNDAWSLCESTKVVPRASDRDALVSSYGVGITVEHILRDLPPNETGEAS